VPTCVNAISLYVEHGTDTFHSVHVETAAKAQGTAKAGGIWAVHVWTAPIRLPRPISQPRRR